MKVFVATIVALLMPGAQAHATLERPKSRNQVARERQNFNGQWFGDYEASALNNLRQAGGFTNSICGSMQQNEGINFDGYSTGPQATYSPGQTITVDVPMRVYHGGHLEFSLCPESSVNNDCFNRNKMRVLSDNLHGAPVDGTYWWRAMLKPYQSRYSFQLQVPSSVSGGNYRMRMKYVTGNSCIPAGYQNYNWNMWGGYPFSFTMRHCDAEPIPGGSGEVFMNCAEVSISGGGGGGGGGGSGTCGNGNRGNGICANGQCCSQYGWCGTSPEHCGSSTTKKGDWEFCSSSSQCTNGCCSKAYSNDGQLKCTPVGGYRADICVARRLRAATGTNETQLLADVP